MCTWNEQTFTKLATDGKLVRGCISVCVASSPGQYCSTYDSMSGVSACDYTTAPRSTMGSLNGSRELVGHVWYVDIHVIEQWYGCQIQYASNSMSY